MPKLQREQPCGILWEKCCFWFKRLEWDQNAVLTTEICPEMVLNQLKNVNCGSRRFEREQDANSSSLQLSVLAPKASKIHSRSDVCFQSAANTALSAKASAWLTVQNFISERYLKRFFFAKYLFLILKWVAAIGTLNDGSRKQGGIGNCQSFVFGGLKNFHRQAAASHCSGNIWGHSANDNKHLLKEYIYTQYKRYLMISCNSVLILVLILFICSSFSVSRCSTSPQSWG